MEKVSFSRGTYRYSTLCVCWINGILCHKEYFGAVTEDKFNEFIIDELSEFIQPYPGQHSVIILDNCSTHHNIIYKQILDELGAIGLFLPRYTPMLNVTEYAFRDIKAKEKQKREYGELEGLISLMESIDSLKNKSYSSIMKKIGYI